MRYSDVLRSATMDKGDTTIAVPVQISLTPDCVFI